MLKWCLVLLILLSVWAADEDVHGRCKGSWWQRIVRRGQLLSENERLALINLVRQNNASGIRAGYDCDWEGISFTMLADGDWREKLYSKLANSTEQRLVLHTLERNAWVTACQNGAMPNLKGLNPKSKFGCGRHIKLGECTDHTWLYLCLYD
ncbi:unnamed protein product [Strongylus vulgaris]|uniref:SCP domain-containing protein n=1 Tax=Strongylus vulgaris TaxID=40348 RepID=A0A3P7I5Y4_STRVU|nr:unnamed protein product [Strongylus vulgaris]